jgi:hypothetical protein
MVIVMICPYCKMKIKDNSSYCIMCGKIFYLEEIGHDAPKMERELISIYYKDGKVPWQIHRISYGYLFFGFLYAIYKKMYVEGIISLITTFLLLFFLIGGGDIIMGSNGFYFYGVISIIFITSGIHFYYLFNITHLKLTYVKTKIARTIVDYKDDEDKQREVCLEDSKNNSWVVYVGAVFVVIVSILLMIITR